MAIKIKGSSTAGAVPASLENRQLAVNTTDKKLFVGDGTAVQTLTGTIASQNANNVNITGGTIDGVNITNSSTSPLAQYNGFTNIVVATSSGSWTVPTGVTKIKITLTGGGGAGGGGLYSEIHSPGGGAGGTCIAVVSVTAGSAYSYTIGAGGVGAVSNGANGGNTTMTIGAVTYTANGGVGGSIAGGASFFSGGTGGTASNGSINIDGGGGGAGSSTYYTVGDRLGGIGGASYWGGGGKEIGSYAANGADGMAYGSGGSGGVNTSGSSASITGGSGKQGIIVIEY